MQTETMTVHEALCELKMLDKRIVAAINERPLAVTNKHINKKIDGVPVKEFEEGISAQFDKTDSLIRRRQAIKRAVVKSNAATEVIIGGETYTVAEAIEMKNHGIEFHQALVTKMTTDYNRAKLLADRANGDDLEKRVQEHVHSIYGNTDMKGVGDEAVQAGNKFREEQTLDIIDPIGIQKRAAEINDMISAFMTEVDSRLSVSNALTQIEVTY